MVIQIEGEYNSATVHGTEDMFGEECIEQIQEMVDARAFEGDNDIAIMSDAHWGSGAVIGFTMPLNERVVPNTIGVDIGCGMYATNFGEVQIEDLEQLDREIRSRVPTGFDVHDRNEYHIVNDFPWDECRRKLSTISTHLDFEMPDPDTVYTDSYFNELCEEIGYDQTRAINSVGTLGGGNHFIELGRDSDNHIWCIIHSGSRGIGAEIAQYWQDRATEKTFERRNIIEIPQGEVKYFEFEKGLQNDGEEVYTRPSDISIDREAVLEDYDGEAIEGKFGQLKSFMNAGKSDASPMDYLKGDEMRGYIIDMIFAQTYASESRKKMAASVSEALGAETTDSVESVHNYIDFEDATIRKGACRAHDGERLVVPFNMKYGTIIARGKGQESWNKSSAHGAGRAMSRTEAKNKFDKQDFNEQIGDVYMSKQPMDEIPGAYKSPEDVEAALGHNVTVENRIEPFLSIKAE